MPVWTAEQLNRFELQGEEIFADSCKCLIDRTALSIVSGTSLYTLPEEVIDIRRVTYRGLKVYPMSHRDSRQFFDGRNPSGKPYNYIFDNLGQLVIKLFPTPAETIVAATTDLFTPTVIAAQCIVEYYRSPDGVNFKIPEFMRRRLLKAYVLKQAFSVESKGQNLKAAKYWSDKWDYMLETYINEVNDLITAPRKLIANDFTFRKYGIPRPTLPLSMLGTGVDDDE